MHYVWDIFGNIIAEANGSTGATLREMVYLEGMPLSAIDAAASPKQIYAVHADHLNRPVMLTNAAKATVWSAIYEPFGRVHSVTGTVTQNLGLPGQWFQLEHGLAYNCHRHYDPTTGRYTTTDPLGFVDGPSIFAYAGSAPHTEVDPTGQNALVKALLQRLFSKFLPKSPSANPPSPNQPPTSVSTGQSGAQSVCPLPGVPKHWVQRPARRAGHEKWVDPNNTHNYVRIRSDGSVTQVKNGKALDAAGNPMRQNAPEAHNIPREQFIFRP